MGSRLFGLARAASEYARRRYGPGTRAADESIDRSSGYVRDRRQLLARLRDYVLGRRRSGGSPEGPPQPPQPGGPTPPGGFETLSGAPPIEDIPETSIQLLGRDVGSDLADFRAMMDAMRLVNSSNVYGYFFERESRTYGILYVTFLNWAPGMRPEERHGPGQTYAYYNIPVHKAIQFQKASESSAGKAVWDYCRIRGSRWAHQHIYRLVQSHGEYVPRRSTAKGYRARAVPDIGVGRRQFRRSTLAPITFSRGDPRRGVPNRAEPDRTTNRAQ